MQTIRIDYDDGTSEDVQVTLEAGLLAGGQLWLPGHLVAEPQRCAFGGDFFTAALDEGGLMQGEVRPEEADIDPGTGAADLMGFRWKLVGTDEDACRDKLRHWITKLGAAPDPWSKGASFLAEPEAARFDRDMACILHVLENPEEEAAALVTEAGLDGGSPPRL